MPTIVSGRASSIPSANAQYSNTSTELDIVHLILLLFGLLLCLSEAGWVVLLLQVNLQELIDSQVTGGRVLEVSQSLPDGTI